MKNNIKKKINQRKRKDRQSTFLTSCQPWSSPPSSSIPFSIAKTQYPQLPPPKKPPPFPPIKAGADRGGDLKMRRRGRARGRHGVAPPDPPPRRWPPPPPPPKVLAGNGTRQVFPFLPNPDPIISFAGRFCPSSLDFFFNSYIKKISILVFF